LRPLGEVSTTFSPSMVRVSFSKRLFIGLTRARDSTVHIVEDKEIDGEVWLIDASGNKIIQYGAFKAYSYGHDFGWTGPAAQVAVAWDNDGRAYALDEFYKSQSPKEELLENAVMLEGKYGGGIWWCDAPEPETIEYLREKVSAKKNESNKDGGIRELGSRFAKQGDGKCRLYVHKRCPNLISELMVYYPKTNFDHAVDALRYAVMGGRPNTDPIQILLGKRP
jgi:hypothetical protein